MIKTIQLELYKFRKNPTITTLFVLFLILTPVASLISNEFSKLQDKLPFPAEKIMDFPQIWDWMGYVGSWTGFFFLGVIAIYIVTTEISYKTLRQGIINGQTRNEFFISKLYSILFLSFIATVYYAIWTMIIGFINTGMPEMDKLFGEAMPILRFFLMMIGFLSFAFFTGVLVKRSGLAVFIYLSYILAIEPILRYGIHKRLLGQDLIVWYPMNVFEDLMPFPGHRLVQKLPDSGEFYQLLDFSQATIGTILYSCIFIVIAYRLFTKRDL